LHCGQNCPSNRQHPLNYKFSVSDARALRDDNEVKEKVGDCCEAEIYKIMDVPPCIKIS